MAKKKTNKKKKIQKPVYSIEQQQNKQLIAVLTVMLLVFGGFIAGYLFMLQQNKFSYAGVDFIREKEGNLVFYHARFPVVYQGNLDKIFNLYLRLDPRKNKVPIETNFTLSREIIISFDPEIQKCDKAIIAQSNLAQFVSVFPWVNSVRGAVSDKEYSEQFEIEYADCDSANPDKTIILAQFSDSPSIQQPVENCFVLNIGECEYLKTSEKYIIGVIAQINDKKI